MRAAVRLGLFGTTLGFTNQHPRPDGSGASGNDVVIKVKAAAINPVDYKLPRAFAGDVYGIDVSGVIQSFGGGASGSSSGGGAASAGGFRVGDEVFGRAFLSSKKLSGSVADFTVASVEEISHKPEFLSHVEAAALPTAYLTSYQALRYAGKVKPGSSVLIIGASGGCGLAGMQLAKAMGAKRIVGICSKRNAEFVLSSMGGGDENDNDDNDDGHNNNNNSEKSIIELVDYTDEAALARFFSTNANKFDCVYDTATGSGGGEYYTSQSMPLLLSPEEGEYVQINGGVWAWLSNFMGCMPKQRSLLITKKSRSDLDDIVSLLKKNGCKPELNVKPFDETGVKEGFELLKSRRTRGKIVFDVGQEQEES